MGKTQVCVSQASLSTTTLYPQPMADATIAEFDADAAEFPQGFLAMGAVGGGVVLLGVKQLAGDGFSPLARAPTAAVPQRHGHACGAAQLADGEAGIFPPHASDGTRPGTDD